MANLKMGQAKARLDGLGKCGEIDWRRRKRRLLIGGRWAKINTPRDKNGQRRKMERDFKKGKMKWMSHSRVKHFGLIIDENKWWMFTKMEYYWGKAECTKECC